MSTILIGILCSSFGYVIGLVVGILHERSRLKETNRTNHRV
jgi:hypothetical protein